MPKSKKSTRDHLLHTAGELFAQCGYEGVSTRTIAERAGVKLSGIHYHFGSKEKLYAAALQLAVESDVCTDFSSVIAENPKLLNSREGLAEIIRTTVFRGFFDVFEKTENPEWMQQFVIREILAPSSVFGIIDDAIIKPDIEGARLVYLAVKPDATVTEMNGWLDMFHSQIFLYVMAKDALEVVRGKGSMDTEFYRGVARLLARAMIFELELPLPKDLQ